MPHESKRDRLILELMLIAVTIALTCLVYRTNGYKFVTLNLFYLPVVLAGFFLGRYATGILAVFCVLTTSMVCALQLNEFATAPSGTAVGLTVIVWAAILCLTALLVGTLSDERTAQAAELHEAYVGVVEVLAKYLQGGDPQLNAATNRVVSLSQKIAQLMRLPAKCIDDIRVAALMQGFSKIEITTKVISKAVHNLEGRSNPDDFSFHGTDLVHSLSGVLRGAIPILVNQEPLLLASLPERPSSEVPIGAQILRVARAYDTLTTGRGLDNLSPSEALSELRSDQAAAYNFEVLEMLDRIVSEQPALIASRS
ncbi:MAG TPA: HD domain-containing phosphohydrolase [Pirellulales bacterium]|nr:HD domain-containing phosphohydrolase [Pirellulales bacterium]